MRDGVDSDHSQQPMSSVELPEGSWWDWDIVSCDAGRLRLGAGYDLTYHHGLELIFHGPTLVRCPTAFHDPVFRLPTLQEVQTVTIQLGEVPPLLVAFEAEAGGSTPATCLIAAENVEVKLGIVFRYRRENLSPGESLAPWVQAP